MFEQATATADARHRGFFDRSGEVRQVWARRADGSLFYLTDGAVDETVRAAARAGELCCPYPGCADRRFIARGGSQRRHHFAHRLAGQEHATAAGWRHQALLMLADWTARCYPDLGIKIDEHEAGESLALCSPRTGRVVRLTVTYDRRYQPPPAAPGRQLLLGHTRGLLLPRRAARDASGRWWCGEGRLVGELLATHEWVLALNPQERLLATLTDAERAREADLIQGRAVDRVLCVVQALEHARLDADGLHTPASDALDHAAERRRAALAELARRRQQTQRAAQQHAERERRHAATPPPMPLPMLPERSARPVSRQHESPQEWPREVDRLRQLLGDEPLARRLEQPLHTDVACDVPVAVWHLIAVLEARQRPDTPHPLAVRAAIVARCGYQLTGDAIAGVLALAAEPTQQPS
jgi:hypothetical protein